MVEQAYGLTGNAQFVNVLVYVSPGSDVHHQRRDQDGYGGEEKALIQKRDFNSYQRSPKWIDPPLVSTLKLHKANLCSPALHAEHSFWAVARNA